ncbi:AAA family ATPase [Paraburkholderia sp.]|uniref:AAA family ATPase n=1 Tax=Paraburkholderia sp. TaxID=1926495 RepID=UPI003C7ABB7C
MGKVFVVANQKGGTGKSTIAQNVAAAFVDDDPELKVLLIDADSQNTSVRMSSIPKNPLPFAVISLAAAGEALGREIQRHAVNYDLTIVDCPPSIDNPNTESAVRAADCVLIPLDASPADAWSTLGMLKMIRRALPVSDQRHCVVVFNRTNVKTVAYREIRDAIAEFENFTILKSVIKQREVYKTCMGLGATVFDAKGVRNLKEARDEIRGVAEEVIKIISK